MQVLMLLKQHINNISENVPRTLL